MLIGEYLLSAAERFPDKEVIIHGERAQSYGELLLASRSVAAWLLGAGLSPGFRGAILSDDPFEYSAAYFGTLFAGGVVVGLNTQTSDRALAQVLADCGAEVLFAGSKFDRYVRNVYLDAQPLKVLAISEDLVTDLPISSYHAVVFADLLTSDSASEVDMTYRSSCDIAQIIYTSGTTGRPKGVALRHANLAANTASIISYLGLTASDRVMAVLPFFYSYGNSVLLTHIAAGASLVVNQSFLYPNVILQQMVDHEVTGFSGVPSTFALLLNRSALSTFSFPNLRYLTQAGAAMPSELARRLHQVFPQANIYIMYGQTEACARLSYLEPEQLERKAGSIGRGIPGVELYLLGKDGKRVKPGEVGEIVARGENIMAGYWQQPKATEEVLRREGLWTGDLAWADAEGYLYIVGRKSDMIKSGAHRIAPKEIEDVLAEHPVVDEVAVVGIADQLLDERIRAYVVLRQGTTCCAKDLQKHCRLHLPSFKVPHEVVFKENLPKTINGKIKKTALLQEK